MYEDEKDKLSYEVQNWPMRFSLALVQSLNPDLFWPNWPRSTQKRLFTLLGMNFVKNNLIGQKLLSKVKRCFAAVFNPLAPVVH